MSKTPSGEKEGIIWVTLDDESSPEEAHDVADTLRDTQLSDKYEIVLTTDRLNTLSQEDVQEVIDELQRHVESDPGQGVDDE